MTQTTNPTPVTPPNRLNPVLLVFLIFPLLGLAVAIAIGGERNRSAAPLEPPPIAFVPDSLVGKVAPDFTLSTPAGKSIALSSLRGQIVFLNFWATWCAPCTHEMPAFQALIDGQIPGKATILAVNQGEKAETVQQFYKDLSLSVPTVLDPNGAVNAQYHLVNLPRTFILDPSGVIRYEKIGMMTTDDLTAYINRLTYF